MFVLGCPFPSGESMQGFANTIDPSSPPSWLPYLIFFSGALALFALTWSLLHREEDNDEFAYPEYPPARPKDQFSIYEEFSTEYRSRQETIHGRETSPV